MNTLKKALVATVAAGSVIAPAVVAPAPASAVPCYTDDQVYVSNHGVTANGVLAWGDAYGGAYRVNLSNTRDGYGGTMVVDFYKHGVGWVDRRQYARADATSYVISATFVKSYQVDKVRFGVARSGSYVYQLLWDVNSACGA